MYSTWRIQFCGIKYSSNFRTLNNLVAAAYAYDLTSDVKYLNGVASGMDYLLGNNPMAFSFITGYGDYHVKNPSHRMWQHEVSPALPQAPDGVIVSGPYAFAEDQYLSLLGIIPGNDENYSQRCYADLIGSISTNATSLGGNAALAWIVSFMQDEAPAMYVDSDVPGDADGNGKLNVSDAVAMVKYLLGDGTLRAPEAADLNKDYRVNAVDLTLLKQLILK